MSKTSAKTCLTKAKWVTTFVPVPMNCEASSDFVSPILNRCLQNWSLFIVCMRILCFGPFVRVVYGTSTLAPLTLYQPLLSTQDR